MKTRHQAILLSVAAFLFTANPCTLAHTDVTAQQAKDLIDSTPDLTVVDVREQYEYCGTKGHIPGALNYPWSSGVLKARYEELPTDGPILVVCASGGRSNAAATFMDSQGFTMIYDMLRGMSVWQWETAPCKYSGGSGTPEDPYQIATAEDLITLGETPEDYDKHFILTADIDLDPNLPGRKVFDRAVIAPDTDPNDEYGEFQGTAFNGVFDGNKKAIRNLTCPLFGYVEGTIKALRLLDPNCTGSPIESNSGIVTDCGVQGGSVQGRGGLVGEHWEGSGGLVGENLGGHIISSYSTTTVTGTGNCIGGLVGFNTGDIVMSYSAGSVSGTTSVGGLVGANGNDYISGSVTQCYSTGPVTGDNAVGGLVGYGAHGFTQGRIWLSYSTGAVSGNSSVGGLVGEKGSSSVKQCYSTGWVIGTDRVGGLVGWNWGDITESFWDIETSSQATSEGGVGKTTADMQDPNLFMAAGWDFVGQPDGPRDTWAEPVGGGYPILSWQLADKSDLPKFSGGTGEPDDPYIISTPMDLNRIACNSRLMGAHFKLIYDLDLAGIDFSVIGDELCPFVGSFDGHGHTITHLTIDTNGPVGLFGQLAYPAEVEDLGVEDVSITGGSAGGLAGINDGGTAARCYSNGVVTGTGWGSGGLMGENYGNLMDCYSIGVVNGTFYVGGLVGTNGDLWAGDDVRFGYITRCYSSCLVNGPMAGGLCVAGVGSLIDSFWDIQASGLTTGDGGVGKTTAEMKTASTFLDAGWDFVDETTNGTEDIWWIDEGKDYPRLWWENKGN